MCGWWFNFKGGFEVRLLGFANLTSFSLFLSMLCFRIMLWLLELPG
jgi:hypothetical protein